jgi:hypothetical protein
MSTIDPSIPIDVDLTRSNGGVWLVKMPKYLSQILNDHANSTPSGEVGRLVTRSFQTNKGATSSRTTGKPPEATFCLNEQVLERLKQQNESKDFQLPPREHRFRYEHYTLV